MREAGEVADDENVRMPGEAAVGLDHDPAGAIERRTGALAPATRPSGEACTPAAQRTVRAAMRSLVPPRCRVTLSASMAVTRVCVQHRHPELRELHRGLCRQLWRKRRQQTVFAFDQQDAASAGLMARKSCFSVWRAISPSAPASSTPVGSAADEHERQPRALRLGIGLALGRLEREQDAPADLGGVLDRLEPGGERRPVGVAEVVMAGPGGDDQRVVAELAVAEHHTSLQRIDVDHLGQQHARVLLPLEHAA